MGIARWHATSSPRCCQTNRQTCEMNDLMHDIEVMLLSLPRTRSHTRPAFMIHFLLLLHRSSSASCTSCGRLPRERRVCCWTTRLTVRRSSWPTPSGRATTPARRGARFAMQLVFISHARERILLSAGLSMDIGVEDRHRKLSAGTMQPIIQRQTFRSGDVSQAVQMYVQY